MRLIPISPLVSVSYEPDGDGVTFYRVFVNNRFSFGAYQPSRKAAEKDMKEQLKIRGLF